MRARRTLLAVVGVLLFTLGVVVPGARGAGYIRPKASSPFRVALVPAYKQCTAPNRIHGPALEFGSCNPPAQTSDFLTVGTEDANGQSANSEGMIKVTPLPGDPQTPQNEADVKVSIRDTDIRNKSDLSDYSGQLQATLLTRITDSFNSISPSFDAAEPATMIDIPFPVNVTCAVTVDPSIGSSCAIDTTLNARVTRLPAELGLRALVRG